MLIAAIHLTLAFRRPAWRHRVMRPTLLFAAAAVLSAALALPTAVSFAQWSDTCPTTTGSPIPYPTGGSPYDPGAGDDDDGGTKKDKGKKKKRGGGDKGGGANCPAPGAGTAGGPTSNGGQPGGGVVSGTNSGPTTYHPGSGRVKVEGKPVGTIGSPNTHNKKK